MVDSSLSLRWYGMQQVSIELQRCSYRYGVDDGDDNLEEESLYIASEDQLDQLYQRNLQQQLLIQRIIEEQIRKQLISRKEQQPCSRCSTTHDEISSSSSSGIVSSELSSVNQTTIEGECKCQSLGRIPSGCGKGSTTLQSCQRPTYESDTRKKSTAEIQVRPKDKREVLLKSVPKDQCDIHSTCGCFQNAAQYQEVISARPQPPSQSFSQSCSPSCSKTDTMASLRRLKPSTNSRGTSPILRLQSPCPASSSHHSPLISGVQGSSTSVGSNLKPACSSKQIKMSSKIIATTDEICVVIDSQ